MKQAVWKMGERVFHTPTGTPEHLIDETVLVVDIAILQTIVDGMKSETN